MAKFTEKITLSLIKKIVIIAICIGFVLFGVISAAVSWSSYRDYYAEMLERKRVYDEANAVPVTVMNGIEITYADGVEFYDNGKAAPTKNSFSVKGLYTVSGREYEEELSDYELDIPDDFAQNGGTVTATYVHEETKMFDEQREVITDNGTEIITTPVEKHFQRTFTASMNVSLTEVRPEKLVVTGEPYTVCYRENSLFNKTGMTAVVAYNDGSVYDNVDTDDIAVEENKPLKTTDTEVTISYVLDGVSVKGTVPVKVMSEDTFTDGEAVELLVDGGVSVDAGKALSTARADVMVRRSNGNIVRPGESGYSVSFDGSGGDAIARLGEDYIATISVDGGISKKFGVNVVLPVEAESGVLSGCAAEETGGMTVVSGIGAGSSLSYSLTASASTYVDMYADMSNGYIVRTGDKYYSQNIAVNSFMQVYVNDVLRATDLTQMSVGGPYESKEDALADMRRVHIGRFYVTEGDNTVKIVFRNNTNGLKDCDSEEPFGKIDSVGFSAEGAEIFNTFGDYVGDIEGSLSTPELTASVQRSWQNMVDPFIVGSTTDGTYIYYAVGRSISPEQTDADEHYKYLYPVRIVKYDPAGDAIIGYSSQFMAYSSSEWAHYLTVKLFYKSGYVYAFDGEAKPIKVRADELGGNGTAQFSAADEITFPEETVRLLNDLQFSAENQKYAGVGSDGYVHVYGSDMTEESYFNAGTAQPFRLTLDKDYIYVMHGSIWDNGSFRNALYIYGWDGRLVAQTDMDFSGISGTSGTNASERALTQVGTSLYVAYRGWSSPWASAVFKVDFAHAESEEKEVLSLGEYAEACADKGAAMKYDVSQVTASRINGTPNYVHGFCTDGTYFYISANDGTSVKIYKLDMSDRSVVGYTAAYERADDWNNADYIYYRDGYVYVVKYDGNGTVARVRCDDIDMNGTAAIENVSGGIAPPEGKVFKSISYDVTQHKYAAVMTDNTTLCIYDAATNGILLEKSFTWHTMLGTYCDENYVYAVYETSASASDGTTAGILVFSWSGEQVADVTLKNLHSWTSGVNVQGMCEYNGETYFAVVHWGGNGLRVVKLDFDLSVLG